MASNNPVRKAFVDQRKTAKQRDIPFNFTFENWIKWWEVNLGPDWFVKRGCRKGQYVMARFKDSGPYSVRNVKCILHSANTKEAKNNVGAKHPQCKITEKDALYIKNSSKTNELLAYKFGLHKDYVSQIKRGSRWKHL